MKYLIAIAILTATQAFGHPGLTDDLGWHTDWRTGISHCHHDFTPFSNIWVSGYFDHHGHWVYGYWRRR